MGAAASTLSRPSQLSGNDTLLKSEDVRKMSDALFQFMYKDWDTREVWEMANKPEDYVIATNEVHSVREFIEASFKEIGREIV